MKKFMVLVMGLVSLGAMAGCDDDSKSVKVPAAVQAAFGEMFPAASHVEWEDKGGYMVADFRSAGMYMQAWFDAAGKWYMTEEDISYAELPRAVRTAYEAGDYAAWHVDDVDKLLRNGQETVYVLEVERAEQEFDLYYSEDGVLLREVPDRDGNDDHGDMLPQELSKAISDFIARKYPGARIVDAEREKGNTEVDIIFAGKVPDVCREADVVVVAMGKMGFIGAEHLRAGQVVVDVGIHVNEEGKLCGDVRFGEAEPVVEAITPVPGGVGTVTTSVLVSHVVEAAAKAAS